MITLEMQLRVFPYALADLSEEAFIQILDNNIGAHFRGDTNENIVLGGVPIKNTWQDVLKSKVESIEFNFNEEKIEIYISLPNGVKEV